MELLKKRVLAKVYSIIISVKKNFFKANLIESLCLVDDIVSDYKKKKRIIILCSGPSANKAKITDKDLCLVTNSGYSMVNKFDFLYYVNDGYFIKKVLAMHPFFFKKNQKILFYYQETNEHKKGFCFLSKYSGLLKGKKLFFLTELDATETSSLNFKDFYDFYKERDLAVKVQNSGMFLLLFGYMLSVKMNLPLEIYGLDLGIGGEFHFDKKGVVGKSVIDNRVKKNTEVYLNYMYSEKSDIFNYSYFKSNIE
jgi:hypothetical protein